MFSIHDRLDKLLESLLKSQWSLTNRKIIWIMINALLKSESLDNKMYNHLCWSLLVPKAERTSQALRNKPPCFHSSLPSLPQQVPMYQQWKTSKTTVRRGRTATVWQTAVTWYCRTTEAPASDNIWPSSYRTSNLTRPSNVRLVSLSIHRVQHTRQGNKPQRLDISRRQFKNNFVQHKKVFDWLIKSTLLIDLSTNQSPWT